MHEFETSSISLFLPTTYSHFPLKTQVIDSHFFIQALVIEKVYYHGRDPIF